MRSRKSLRRRAVSRARVPVTSAWSSSLSVDSTVVMKTQTWPRRRSSFNRSASASASRRCSSICQPSPSWRSTGRSSRRISKACSSAAWLSGKALRILIACSNQVRASESAARAAAFMAEIVHCLLLQLGPDRVMGEPLDLLAEPVGVQLFYGVHDARVDVATALVEHPSVGDVVGEGVLEGVLQVREELRRVEKFSSLQVVEQAAKLVLCQPANCM